MILDSIDIISNFCGIAGIGLFIFELIRILKSNDFSGKWINGIWILGLISFLITVTEQTFILSDIFKAVSEAQAPDVNAIADGLSRTFSKIFKGLLILTTLFILWTIVKHLIRQRRNRLQ